MSEPIMLKINYGTESENNKFIDKVEVKENGAMSFATNTGYLYFGFDGNAIPVKTPEAAKLENNTKDEIINTAVKTALSNLITYEEVAGNEISTKTIDSSNKCTLIFFNGLLLANSHYEITNGILSLNFITPSADDIIQIIQIKNNIPQ